MAIGQLLVPIIQVIWGDVNLTRGVKDNPASEDASKNNQLAGLDRNLFFDLSMSFRSEGQSHDLNFSFQPDAVGYTAYRKCIEGENRDKAIVVRIGYENGRSFEAEFFYTGVVLGSGLEPSISITAHSRQVAILNKWRFNKVYGDGTKVIPLGETLKGELATNNIVLDADSDFLKTESLLTFAAGETQGQFVQRVAASQGANVYLPVSASKAGYDLKIKYPYATEVRNGGGDVKPADNSNEREAEGDRWGFLIGPQLIQTFTRSVSYNPPTIDKDTSKGTSDTNTNIDQKESKNEEEVEEETDEAAPASKDAVKPEVPGNNTPANEPTTKTLDAKASTEGKEEAKLDAYSELGRECSGEFFMVPYVVGMQPGDFVLLPSLKIIGVEEKELFLEDWELTEVSYRQESGGVNISITGRRWGKDDIILKEESYSTFQKILKTLVSLPRWTELYWGQGAKTSPSAGQIRAVNIDPGTGADPEPPSQ